MKQIAELAIRMACENPRWGYSRIQGALANLGHRVARTTVANILKRHGIELAPERGKRTSWEYERSAKLYPGFYNVFYRLGLAYEEQGARERAIENFRKFIGVTELSPYDATAQGRDASCAANAWCYSISRPEALTDTEDRLARMQESE